MKLAPLASAFRVTHPLKQQCLIALTCLTLVTGCGNDGRESASAQLAQRGLTNSPAGFMKAVHGGDIVAAQLFLNSGFSANTRMETTNGFFTALHLAVDKGNREIATLLLEKGADVNATASGNDTPLHVALGRTNTDLAMVQLLVNNGANVNAAREGGATPLMQAVFGGNLELVNLLLSKGADVNAKEMEGFTALMAASLEGNLAVVRALLKANPDLEAKNASGRTAVDLALARGHGAVVGVLRGPKITSGETARAEEAEQKAREQLARLNLKFPDDFMTCVKNDDALAVRLFLEARINAEQRDSVDGWTALQHAACRGNLQMANLLLNHGVDVLASKRGDDRWRAKEIAVEHGHREMVELLVAAEKKFRASLGTVPGTYFQVEDTINGTKTNKWVFTADGTFRSYWGQVDNPDELRFDGTYRVEANMAVLQAGIGQGWWGDRWLAISAKGLTDSRYRLIKVPENKSPQIIELSKPRPISRRSKP